ncbi:ribosome maturation factor RimM [Deinococcus radiophilus]|uniref:Ribosome maturation factor RimM n=1 Tax=Deinococcus radiophilus TaxID=32062 RepID=A0A3S0I9Z1_9DEIO|nr:ribosome maturation factor RimM [Deinococcus radiophilus]RTR30862.1 16S rRNA processing protein RimM [Deinococcus radiophilus]UFA49443.1 ribosome maturation factor RimM [Deinococcus radiophilus]
MSAPENTTRIGYFLGPQGLKGGVKLFVLGEAEQLRELPRVWVEGWGWLKLRRTELTYPGIALFPSTITTREAAADLRGAQVYADDADLPALEEGSYYYHELRELPVWQEGRQIGAVVDVLDMGYQDLLVVSHDLGESQIPLQAPYVVIEDEDGAPTRIVLTEDTPGGLLGEDEIDDEDGQDSED